MVFLAVIKSLVPDCLWQNTWWLDTCWPYLGSRGQEPISFRKGLLSCCCCWLRGCSLECVALSGLCCIMQAIRVILELQKIYSPHFLPLMRTICVSAKGTVCQEGMQKGENGKEWYRRTFPFFPSSFFFAWLKLKLGFCRNFKYSAS